MKKIIFIVALSLVSKVCFAQAPDWEWAKSFYGTGACACISMTIDASNNIYTTGVFNGTVDFDPGTGTYLLASYNSAYDVFISKSDSLGNFIWAKRIGGNSHDYGESIAVDSKSNVYVTGYFGSTVDFDPGLTQYNIASNGFTDVFILKLDSSGNFLFAKNLGGSTGLDQAYSIAIDLDGNIYTTGYFSETADFDPGVGVFNLVTSSSNGNIFVSKLDSLGNFIWAKAIIGTNFGEGKSLIVDTLNNVFITGIFYGFNDFDPGSGTFYLNSSSLTSVDAFILKLDSSGSFVWAKKTGGGGAGCEDISLDDSGNIYTVGSFGGTVDFDPGLGIFNITSQDYDVFIWKLDNAGNFAWAKSFGGTGNVYSRSIAIDSSGNIFFVGNFNGTVDFNPDASIFSLSATADYDIFICKLNYSGNFLWVKSSGGAFGESCTSVKVNDINVFISGAFLSPNLDFDSILLSNPLGGQASYIAMLLSCETYFEINEISCNSYVPPSGNHNWNLSGIYKDIIPNSVGCDSIITINLTINNTSSSQTISTCNNFTSPSGNFIWTTSGIYNDTISNAAGCDSIITINLTINSANTSVTQNGFILSSNAIGATYQWLDCNNNFAAISGATNQSYTATANGNYAVQVTYNGCTDTSACYTITGVGINEIATSNNFQVFPNPTADRVTVHLYSPCSNCTIEISNTLGEVVQSAEFKVQSIATINLQSLPSGIYFIKVKSDKWSEVKRVVKE